MVTSDFDAARAVLEAAASVAVLTGAGISTDSGIPDFRGPSGVWTKDPEAEKYSSIDHYLSDPELRVRAWRFRMDNPAWTARPNPGHRALVELEHSGRLTLLATQNIDGLHLAAGTDPDRLVEVHGTIRDAVCTSCRWTGQTAAVLDRVRAGEPDPRCEWCDGILKTATVFFGEHLRDDHVDRAFAAAEESDVLLCVGTSLQVYPIAQMVPRALRSGSLVIIVNAGSTPFDDDAMVVGGSISEVLPQLLGQRGVTGETVREQTGLSDS